jgi:hypothetical protein
VATGDISGDAGYFRFGSAGICYGQCSSGVPAESVIGPLHDTHEHVSTNGSSVQLPFDPVQVVNNLRYERYLSNTAQDKRAISANSLVRNLYYLARPLMPVAVRKHLQRRYFRGWDKILFPSWPVDFTVETIFEQLLILSMKFHLVLAGGSSELCHRDTRCGDIRWPGLLPPADGSERHVRNQNRVPDRP